MDVSKPSKYSKHLWYKEQSHFHQQHHAFLCMWGFREALNKRFDTYHKPFNNTQHLVNPKDSPPGEKMSVD